MPEDWSSWLSDAFDQGQLAALRDVRVELGPTKSSSLGELMYAWKLHIDKLIGDTLRFSGDRSLWGAHDYVAALVIRDSIETGLGLLGADHRKLMGTSLTDTDSMFKEYTEEDRDGCTGRILGEEVTDRPWWWGRIPRQGPVRREIETHYGHRADPR